MHAVLICAHGNRTAVAAMATAAAGGSGTSGVTDGGGGWALGSADRCWRPGLGARGANAAAAGTARPFIVPTEGNSGVVLRQSAQLAS